MGKLFQLIVYFHQWCMDIHRSPWMTHGYPWMIHVYRWIIHGISIDNPWIIHARPWIIYGYPEYFSWPNDTTLKLKGVQSNQTRYMSCATLQMSRFVCVRFLLLWISTFLKVYFYRNRQPARLSLEADGANKDLFASILPKWLSKTSQSHDTASFVGVSRDTFRQNSVESMRNRHPVIS